jgi:hypothetical protein
VSDDDLLPVRLSGGSVTREDFGQGYRGRKTVLTRDVDAQRQHRGGVASPREGDEDGFVRVTKEEILDCPPGRLTLPGNKVTLEPGQPRRGNFDR